MASAALIKSIYALASSLGIKGNGHDDNLHLLVYAITGKESIKNLEDSEAKQVRSELMRQMKGTDSIKKSRPKKKSIDIPPGKMTKGQQDKAWWLIYKLCELDPSDSEPSVRMQGAAKKILDRQLNMNNENPFRMITVAEGSKFIDVLKKYVDSAEKKKR